MFDFDASARIVREIQTKQDWPGGQENLSNVLTAEELLRWTLLIGGIRQYNRSGF